MSIKLPDFKLSYVYAIEGHAELTNSANMPLIVTALDQATGQRGDYVVKLNASERMHVEGRLRELIAAFMAMELEIPVVIPAIVEVSEEFCETLKGKDYYLKASKSLGYNVASEYLTKHIILDNHISLGPQQEKVGQQLFAFDVLVDNTDRNWDKPNMLTDGQNLVALDHELAFQFLMVLPFLRNPTPWELRDADKTLYEKHCLCHRLKGKTHELDAFSEKLVNLDPIFWDKVKSLIPPEWYVDELYTGIRERIDALVAHRQEFITHIKALLA